MNQQPAIWLLIGCLLASPTWAAGPKKVDKNKKVVHAALFKPHPVNIEMVKLEGGTFVMGCQSGRDLGCFDDELPPHNVSIKPFEIGRTEVTRSQWQALMGGESQALHDDKKREKIRACGPNCPVESVTWEDVQTFIQKLNQKTGLKYRLPTEAEWEYAYRSNTKTTFYTGNCILPDQADYDTRDDDFNGCHSVNGIYEETTVPVATHPANPWGLFDMAGSLWEWTQDTWHDDYQGAPTDGSAWEGGEHFIERVLRGGSWASAPRDLRASVRMRYTAASRSIVAGFRLARSLP